MTAQTLRELEAKADNTELIAYLRNHAKDFIRLMEAVEGAHSDHLHYCKICNAIAAFKEQS